MLLLISSIRMICMSVQYWQTINGICYCCDYVYYYEHHYVLWLNVIVIIMITIINI